MRTGLFTETVDYWQRWLAKCTYKGRWREMVHRSALILKLLIFRADRRHRRGRHLPVCRKRSAASATGITATPGFATRRSRCTRFCASVSRKKRAQFMSWIEARCHEMEADGSLNIMYGIDGRHDLREETLDHLEGYRGSSPVRIGNGAYDQLQLDIYGELMDSVYLYNKYGSQISYDLWRYLRRLTNWVCDHWKKKDEGIWEVRSGRQHFLYSRLMCWVAIDRALRLADKRSFPADRERWIKVRDEIYEEIQAQGWSTDRNAFVQYYGSDSLDAALLMMPLVFFMSPTDPRIVRTLDAITAAACGARPCIRWPGLSL